MEKRKKIDNSSVQKDTLEIIKRIKIYNLEKLNFQKKIIFITLNQLINNKLRSNGGSFEYNLSWRSFKSIRKKIISILKS